MTGPTTVGMEFEIQPKRAFTGVMAVFITLLAVGFSLFEIIALQFVIIDLWVFEAVVLAIVMVLGYLTIPASPRRRGRVTPLDLVLLAAGVAPCIYVIVDLERLQWTYGSTVEPLDIVFGSMLIVSLLELTRRSFGLAMPIVALVFLAYGLFGNHLPPWLFGHTGLRPGNVIGFMIGNMAIFGPVMSVMVQIIFLFMLFSAFLQISGAGDFFVNLANAVAGRWRGGPAKVSVFSSSLFGTISGSSVANVAVDGGITIPLMIKTGFRPHFAAAVEATASTGGQIMPPIMGAGAFIMAELLNISYAHVIVAATLPAILYYVGLYCMIDLEAVKQGLRGVQTAGTAGRMWVALKEGGHLLIPVFVLLHQTVIAGTSVQRAGFYSIIAAVLVSWVRRRTRIGWTRLVQGLRDGAMSSVSIAAVCATAGIIVGIVSMTGLGVKFSSVVVGLAQGNLFITLALTAVICVFLGMGVPTTAAYIIAAAVGVPALLALGADPLAAHLFVFYFACISAITPPVAGAVYTACGFSGSSVMQTGWTATRLGIAAYIVPFLFVYHPVLLFKGTWPEIAQATASAVLGVAAVSMAMIGTSFVGGLRWNLLQRAIFLAAFFALLMPGTFSDLLGLAAVAAGVLMHPRPWQALLTAVTGRKRRMAIAAHPPDGRG
ncbi:MAG: TRAP transporter fused permease subunit [Candidatus Rokubacteria bacterium]|nr:TRAP transporter fused permease subunit [Candidatus Rokubacteria bacterium]